MFMNNNEVFELIKFKENMPAYVGMHNSSQNFTNDNLKLLLEHLKQIEEKQAMDIMTNTSYIIDSKQLTLHQLSNLKKYLKKSIDDLQLRYSYNRLVCNSSYGAYGNSKYTENIQITAIENNGKIYEQLRNTFKVLDLIVEQYSKRIYKLQSIAYKSSVQAINAIYKVPCSTTILK